MLYRVSVSDSFSNKKPTLYSVIFDLVEPVLSQFAKKHYLYDTLDIYQLISEFHVATRDMDFPEDTNTMAMAMVDVNGAFIKEFIEHIKRLSSIGHKDADKELRKVRDMTEQFRKIIHGEKPSL